jgi:alanine racemase
MDANTNGSYSNWVEIDLAAVEENVRLIHKKTNLHIMAVVKANGYGHGAVQVARAAQRAGASWFGVARLEEALELRRAGLDHPVLLLGHTPPQRYEEAIVNQISLTVWDFDQVSEISQAANRVDQPARLHLKVDTGMSRLGVQPQDALKFARKIITTRNVLFEGLFTHFARADEADPKPTEAQEKIFQEVIRCLEDEGIQLPWLHAANSAASLTRPAGKENLVRAGIAIYGLHPSSQCPLPEGFRPALTWKSILSQVKTLPPGRGVSYGHIYVTSSHERIGTIPVGYADGFRRITANQVLVGGVKVPVVGRVCMDQALVQLDAVPQAKAGDEVVIIGSQGQNRISAEEVAARWGTINYEVVCGIGARVPRLYS